MRTVNVLFRVRPEKRDEFLQTVQSMQGNLEKEEADLTKASLYQNLNDANVFHFSEEWTTADAMERYLRSDRFDVLMGALKVLCAEAEVTCSFCRVPLLQVTTTSQFKAVLAHEFGHYYVGDTSLGPWIYNTRSAIGLTLEN